jgi:molybdopterin-containing oxidoreductase family iron-sulfur binding subunit
MSPADMEEMQLQTHLGQQSPASLCTVKVSGQEIILPCVAVPGQSSGTLGIALGYGRGANGEKVGMSAVITDPGADEPRPVGKNAYPLTALVNGATSYILNNVEIASTGETYDMAITQTHLTDMQRHSVVKETSLAMFETGKREEYNEKEVVHMHYEGGEVKEPVGRVNMWEDFAVAEVGHRWA